MTVATPFSTGAVNVSPATSISTVPPALESGSVTTTVPSFKSFTLKVMPYDEVDTFNLASGLVIALYLPSPL